MCARGGVRCAPTTKEYMLIRVRQDKKHSRGRSCVAVMTNYARGRPRKTVIGHSLQLKNATRLLFDSVIRLYSLFALRTAGHRENDNVEGFYKPIVYPQKKIVHQPFRV